MHLHFKLSHLDLNELLNWASLHMRGTFWGTLIKLGH